MAHRADANRSDVTISRIADRGRLVRYWFSANGCLVGIWQGRNGKTYAVGHNQAGNVILYRAGTPVDAWANGSGNCLNPTK